MDFEKTRSNMVKDQLRSRNISHKAVLAAFMEIPREDFVPDNKKKEAYHDGPLPIGNSQTISQPYIVALMSQELEPDSKKNVLEIGTGSGYQTAILAKLFKKVYTVERIEELSLRARKLLKQIDITNVEYKIDDGSLGWKEKGPFDRIILTAAAPKIPDSLAEQLAEGGNMVLPVGGVEYQKLIKCKKINNKIIEEFICDVRFVKMIGKEGF